MAIEKWRFTNFLGLHCAYGKIVIRLKPAKTRIDEAGPESPPCPIILVTT